MKLTFPERNGTDSPGNASNILPDGFSVKPVIVLPITMETSIYGNRWGRIAHHKSSNAPPTSSKIFDKNSRSRRQSLVFEGLHWYKPQKFEAWPTARNISCIGHRYFKHDKFNLCFEIKTMFVFDILFIIRKWNIAEYIFNNMPPKIAITYIS